MKSTTKKKKTKAKYRIWFGNEFEETMAVSEKQAVNNVKGRMGLAGSYEYHLWQPTKIEIIGIYES